MAALALAWLTLLGSARTADAQAAASGLIASLDTNAFPQMQLYLDLHGADGTFISGIEAEQVTVFENNQPLQPTDFQQMRTGVQFVTAITLGPSFGVRDGQGVSRYEYLIQGLRNWQWKPNSGDDLSLLVSSGPELIHSSSPDTWLQALESYKPDARQETPNLALLNRALDVAADQPPQPGMDRAVLFITPPLGTEATLGLQSLARRALEEGTRIHIWLVAAPEFRESVQADMLSDLAAQTSGSYFFYTGTETVPDLETYLEPLRAIYRLSYTSAITTTGAFPVRVEAALTDTTVVTPDKLVQYDVQPPNPVFLAAPAEILRAMMQSASSKPAIQTTVVPWADRLIPAEQKLQILVEFPDGRIRDIQRSALYVNGILEVEHTQPPFDQFTWNLQSITQTQQILLRAEVTDALGLTSSTVELPVQVTVQVPAQNRFGSLSTRSVVLIAVTVGLAGMVLVLVLVMGGRIRPHVFGRPEGQRASLSQAPTRPIARSAPTQPSRQKTTPARHLDPVTQPVNIPQPASERKRWTIPDNLHFPAIPALRWAPARPANKPCYIYLEPLPVGEESASLAPLPLAAEEIIIGWGQGKATLIINDPSLDEVHAVLKSEAGSFRLRDAGSTAGTWVNFTPTPEEGVLLQHGDLIHLGRVGFRFSLRTPGRTRKPSITPDPHRDVL